MMHSQKVVMPAKAGIQYPKNYLKRLDSRLHGNDGKCDMSTYYEIIMHIRAMKTIASIMIVGMILFTSSSSSAGDDYVNYARSLQAKDYDQNLPGLPIDQWLKDILPKGIIAVWGDTVTDCGEQTGNPAIDKERDIPLCAEVVLKQKEKEVGYLMFFVGTEKKGKLKEQSLYFGNFKQDDKTIWIKKLSELTKFKQQ